VKDWDNDPGDRSQPGGRRAAGRLSDFATQLQVGIEFAVSTDGLTVSPYRLSVPNVRASVLHSGSLCRSRPPRSMVSVVSNLCLEGLGRALGSRGVTLWST
jgi:hypothetical protein